MHEYANYIADMINYRLVTLMMCIQAITAESVPKSEVYTSRHCIQWSSMFCIKIKFISKSLESAHEQFGLSMRLSNVTMISVQKKS